MEPNGALLVRGTWKMLESTLCVAYRVTASSLLGRKRIAKACQLLFLALTSCLLPTHSTQLWIPIIPLLGNIPNPLTMCWRTMQERPSKSSSIMTGRRSTQIWLSSFALDPVRSTKSFTSYLLYHFKVCRHLFWVSFFNASAFESIHALTLVTSNPIRDSFLSSRYHLACLSRTYRVDRAGHVGTKVHSKLHPKVSRRCRNW